MPHFFTQYVLLHLSILPLKTWEPQSKLAIGQTPHVGWPSGLRPSAKPNHTVCSLPRRCLIVRPYANSFELSYSADEINISSCKKLNIYCRTLADEAQYYSTIYPNSCDLGTTE